MDARYREEIEQLYLQLYSKLFVYARSILGNDALAEEAVQETFRIACQRAQVLCESANPSGWLFNTLKFVISNELHNRITSKRLLTEYHISRPSEHKNVQEQISLDLLYGDISETEEYQLLKELVVEGKSHLQMAEARGITITTCRKRVQRAKEFLQKFIEKN